MRKRLLSVYVCLLLNACTGSVEDAADDNNIEGGDGGAEQRDGSTLDASRGDGGNAWRDDASGGSRDAQSGSDAAGQQDAASASDASTRDAGTDAGRDGGSGNSDASTPPPDAGGGNSGRPVFVIAGYRHGIAFSTDLGVSWTTVHGPTGPFADNQYVISGAGFSNGTFVVAGFDIFSSTDGEHWTERTNPTSEWLGNVSVGEGLFVGVGGYGTSLWSPDGISWTKGTMLGTDGFDTSAYGNGTFTASSKDGQWWSSGDGKSWMRLDGESGHSAQIVWCNDHFADEDDCNALVQTGQTAFGANVWIRATHNTNIERSTNNGQSWSDVSVGFEANCVAFGYVQ